MECKSETIGKLAEALSKAQAAMEPAIKDAENPFFKSHYADLSSVWEVARKPLTDNGLSVAQLTDVVDGNSVVIETVLMHMSGEWIRGLLRMPYAKVDPQAVGSAITYGRRYALAAILGIVADEDDDANSAGGKATPPEKTKESLPKNAPPPTDVKLELHDGLDLDGMKLQINNWLTEMFGPADVADQLEKMTAWTNSEGKAVPGKKSIWDVGSRPNNKGKTQVSVLYLQCRKLFKDWKENN
jgi:hypothetical protein